MGLLTPIAVLVGPLLVISYGLATQWSPEQRGLHLGLGAAMLAFLLARAGQTWGLSTVGSVGDAARHRRLSTVRRIWPP